MLAILYILFLGLMGTAKVTVQGKFSKKNVSTLSDAISYTGKNLFLVTFTVDGKEYKNHYYTELLHISFADYMRDLKKAGLDHFSF